MITYNVVTLEILTKKKEHAVLCNLNDTISLKDTHAVMGVATLIFQYISV